MRTLVIGAAGFIGRRLMGELGRRGIECVGADVRTGIPEVDVALDIGSRADVERMMSEVCPESVVVLASLLTAATELNPADALRVNVSGPAAVFEAAVMSRVRRILYASSISTYGRPADGQAVVDENSELRPKTLYDWMKCVAEALAANYARRTSLETVVVRPSICYGMTESVDHDNIVGQLLAAAVAGRRTLQLPYAGGQSLSLIHVDDAAAAFAVLAQSSAIRWPVYNTGGQTVSVEDLANAADTLLGLKVDIDPSGAVINAPARVSGGRLSMEFGLAPRGLASGMRTEIERLGLTWRAGH